MKISPPKAFGLSLRTAPIENQRDIAIIVDLKSRFTMKDEEHVLELSKFFERLTKPILFL